MRVNARRCKLLSVDGISNFLFGAIYIRVTPRLTYAKNPAPKLTSLQNSILSRCALEAGQTLSKMQKTLGLILKKQNIGETDRIITIFSPSLGKKRIIARAVRRTTSKLAGHLDTFMVSQLMLTDHPDLPKVTSAQLIEPFEAVRGSLISLERAFAITKIIERVIVEDVSQQSIFQLTLDALSRMNDGQKWPAVWLYFLGTLTNRLGLAVNDFDCLSCGKRIDGPAWWVYSERRFACRGCVATKDQEKVALEFNSVKLLRLLQSRPYAAIQSINFNEIIGQQVEEVLLREVTEWFNKPWLSYASLASSKLN